MEIIADIPHQQQSSCHMRVFYIGKCKRHMHSLVM